MSSIAAASASGATDLGEKSAIAHFYRPDVDGLRAVAVVAVVLYHVFPRRFVGGFVGVDVFFVISGYLISLNVLADLEAGRFTFANFYARRVRRIFPALAAVLLACLALAHLLAFPDELATLGKHVVAGVGFVSNLVLWSESGYFERAAETKPLLHLWSLGVEEQFYIVWPVVALLLWHVKRAFSLALLALFAVSLLANLMLVHDRQSLVFYMPFTRFWELLVGCMLAAAAYGRFGQRAKAIGTAGMGRWGDAASVAGAVLLGASFVVIDTNTTFPGAAAMMPVAGTALLIGAGGQAWVNRSLLSLAPAVGVGLISYPLYLWHWPVLVFGRLAYDSPVARWAGVVVILVSILLAYLTYRFIERPLRFGSMRARAIPLLSAVMVAIAVLGAVTWGGGLPSRYSDRAAFLANFANDPPGYAYMKRVDAVRIFRLDCNFFDDVALRVRDALPRDCHESTRPSKVLLWGDSHAQHLRHGIQQRLGSNVGILQVTSSGCPPSLRDIQPDRYGSCNRSNRFALETVRLQQPQVVVIAQSRDHGSTNWAELVQALRTLGVRHVLIVGPVPQWEPDLRLAIAKHHWPEVPTRLTEHLRPAPAVDDGQMKRTVPAIPGATLVSAMDLLCDGAGCLTFLGDDPAQGLTTFDYGHLTPPASELVGGHVADVMARLMAAPGAPAVVGGGSVTIKN